jgi:hypothetical protein
MKQNLLLVLFLNIAFSATAQTDSIEPVNATTPRHATITTTDGEKIKGWFYTMDNDNMYLLPTGKNAKQYNENTTIGKANGTYRIDAAQINTISLKKKNAGLKGALIGMGAGIVIGAAAGFASGDDPVTPYTGNPFGDILIGFTNSFTMTAGEKAVGMGVVGALTGALIGGITGALLKKQFIIGGKKDNYRNAQAELNKRAMVKF